MTAGEPRGEFISISLAVRFPWVNVSFPNVHRMAVPFLHHHLIACEKPILCAEIDPTTGIPIVYIFILCHSSAALMIYLDLDRAKGFIAVTNCGAAGLKTVILNLTKEYGIDLTKCRGQGYDGANVMSEGLIPKIINERFDVYYGRSSPFYSAAKEWAKRFRMGQEFLEDDERPGRPVEVITEDKVALVEELVLSDVEDEEMLSDIKEMIEPTAEGA
nr:unnamed protein product [Callosobruchus analis]